MNTPRRPLVIWSFLLSTLWCLASLGFAQAPVITGFTPPSGPEQRMVTVTGMNFSGTGITNRIIRVNGVQVTTSTATSTQLIFPVPVGATTGPITVETSQGFTTSATDFVVQSGPPPANDDFANAAVLAGIVGQVTGNNANATRQPGEPVHPANAGGASVWFTWIAPTTDVYLFNPHFNSGSNFGGVLGIYTGNSLETLVPLATSSANSTFARFSAAAVLNAIAGVTYHIALDGFGGVMGDYALGWAPLAPPVVTGTNVPSGYAGQPFTISGSGFAPGAIVVVGGTMVNPNRVTVTSPTSISVSQIPYAATTGPIVVITPAGTAASPVDFIVNPAPPPSISSFTPGSGGAGTNVSITGTALWLGDGTPVTVRFNGVPASPITLFSGTSISARVPSGATTGPITVETPAGAFTTPNHFTVTSSFLPPAILSFLPASGTVGTTVHIFGQNFVGATAVLFNGTPAGFTVNTDSVITATVPPGATSGPITIVNPAGSVASSESFSVLGPPPTITGFSPTTVAPGMWVSITGTNFTDVLAVDFNGVGTAFFVDSPTQISALVPFAPLISGPIRVLTTSGLAISPMNFTVASSAAPTISGFSPNAISSGTPVVITGTNFIDVTAVLFNGVSAAFTVDSPAQITATAPPPLTAGPITVITAHGSAVSPTNYTLSLAPVITGFTPASGPEKRMVTVTGMNFSGPNITSRTVRVNGVAVSSLSVGATQLTFPIPVGATTGPITVQTAHGLATSATPFIVEAGPPPTNDNFANAQVLTGDSGIVDVNTTNATRQPGEPNHAGNSGGASVWFAWTAPSSGPYLFNPQAQSGPNLGVTLGIYIGNSVDALALVASGSSQGPFARFSSAAILNATAGVTYRIALDGFGGLMGEYRLAWSPLAPPAITSAPGSAVAGQSITIQGSGFAPGAAVSIGGIAVNPAHLTYTSAFAITVTQVPAGISAGFIVVTTPAGAAASPTPLTLAPTPPPSISSISPTSGQVGSSVTISGAALSTGDDMPLLVTFNGVPVATITSRSFNSLAVRVPTGATTGTIAVQNPQGFAVSAGNFTVTSPSVPMPFIFDFAPASGPVGSVVAINGANLLGATEVRLNEVPVPFNVDSANQISVSIPPGATSGQFRVITPGGLPTSPNSFQVTTPPVISSFSPATVTSGTPVTISGAHFSGVAGVAFNGVSASFTVDANSQITAITPTGLVTGGPITVTTLDGIGTSPASFSLGSVNAPVITGFTPASGPEKRIIRVTGSNFFGMTPTSPPIVRVNGVPISFLTRSDTQLTFAIPVGATTGPITVQTPYGIATSPTDFIVAAGPPPPNDAFASAQVLTGPSGSVTGNLANATKEPGEPHHGGNAGGASVWFAWTAPSSGPYLFNPHAPGTTNFGTLQGIYTGGTVDALTLVASGSSNGNLTRFTGAAVLNATEGATYAIALDGFNGYMGDYRLTWSPLAPPHIGSFSPTTGTAGQMLNIVISGSGFAPGAGVAIGGAAVDAARITYTSATSITITQIPAAALTGPITVTTPAGTATSSAQFEVVRPPPVISAFSPHVVKVGTPITIMGNWFHGTSAVLFNGVPASGFAVDPNGNTITAPVPAGATSGPITVVTPGGSAVSAGSLVVALPPEIVEQPQSQTVTVGDTVTFSVTVTSNTSLEYLWRRNGVPLFQNPTAETSTLVLTNVTTADAGAYDCVVGNPAAIIYSNVALLVVNKAPAMVALSGLSATFDGSPKPVAATTHPAGLPVQITYDGAAPAPSNAGSYAVVATIADANFAGTATGTLTIHPAAASIALGGLDQRYDGTARAATAVTVPAGLPVTITYNDSATPPVLPGAYAAAATFADPNYTGSASGTLVVSVTALVRHLPALDGGLDGSVQVLAPADVALNSSSWISGDLLVPGRPAVQVGSRSTYAGILDAWGASFPADRTVALNGAAVVRYIVRCVNPLPMAAVSTPPSPVGTRSVIVDAPDQDAGDFGTLRDLVLNGNAGLVAVPPGTYGSFTANGQSGFILGAAGATEPAVYHLQSLTLGANARLELAGPVILTLAGDVVIPGQAGNPARPDWLNLRIASGGLTLGANASVSAHVLAPNGTVAIGSGTLQGEVAADSLSIDAHGLLKDVEP